MRELIKRNMWFEVYCEGGRTVDGEPWIGFDVKSIGHAKKFVVDIKYFPNCKGGREYIDRDTIEVSHGMRCERDSFADTEIYIEVLKVSLDFARELRDDAEHLNWLLDQYHYDESEGDWTR